MTARLRRYVAEGLGTFGLVFVGTGAIVANELSAGAVTHVGVSLAFGLVVTGMIVVFGALSGAHINPAVTVGFAFAGELEARDLTPYVASQCVGALAASALLVALHPEAGSYGETRPIDGLAPAFVLELLMTMLLMSVILACAVEHRLGVFATGVAVGGTVALCALFGGPLTGASMNPARSLGPAVVAGRLDVLWLYVVAPILGAVAAVLLYRFVWRAKKLD